MPRPLRTDARGAVHHVMIRGVDGRTIFACDSDAEDFLARFAVLVHELGFVVLAWCLLGNHAHFVLQTGPEPLARLMARLNSRHAQRFNRMSERAGHLFQDRYKAVLIADAEGLARCIAYVLGNPVRHGLMSMLELSAFRFSGYGAMVGIQLPRSFESPAAVASALCVDRDRLESFVRESALDTSAKSAALEPDQIAELDRLVQECCKRHGISAESLRGANRETRTVREAICSLAADALALSIAEVVRRVGIPYGSARRIYARARIPNLVGVSQ